MKARIMSKLCHTVSGRLIWCASMLVASEMRLEWRQEWQSELWYVCHQGRSRPGAESDPLGIVRFAGGACTDALILRRTQVGSNPWLTAERGSAHECFALLLALLCIALGVALLLPNVRSRLRPAHVARAQEVMLIENTVAAEHGDLTLPVAQYERWQHLPQRIFQQFAYYELESAPVLDALPGRQAALKVARVRGDVLSLLGIKVEQLSEDPALGAPAVVISRSLGQRHAAELRGTGHLDIVLDGRRLAVTGIASATTASLPGHPDVWIDAQAAPMPTAHNGFVFGRVDPRFHDASWGAGWRMSAPGISGEIADFTCVSLGQSLRQPWDLFLFAVLLSILALPATTSLPLGEYRIRKNDLPHHHSRRWTFLIVKVAFVLAIAYLGCLDLAFANPHLSRGATEWVELVSCFSGCLWGLRWTLRDQRQRCPVCLRKLSQPAKVGHASRYFLAWSGTELICAGGHGLLHVPEIATSWFETQRWLALDSSWQVLFPGRRSPSTVYF